MVEIKVNTSTDSKEDIKKAVEFLKTYLEAHSNESISTPSPGSMNIFDNAFETKPKSDDGPKSKIEPTLREIEANKDPDEDVQIKPIFY
jgi:hypothetical protein